METATHKPKSKMIIAIAIAALVIAVIGGAIYALILSSAPKQITSTPQESQTQPETTITQQSLAQDMKDVNSAVTDAQKSHSSATAAINDEQKRVKVSQ